MDRYAVAGNPVEHSKSPVIHARFAAQTGEPVEYTRLLVPLDAFAPTLRAFADGGAKGCNVTVPFKFEAYAMATRTSERAALARAANTLRFDAEGWYADNTDGAGLVADVQANAGFAIAGRQVLLVGAGGAAAGVLGPLLQQRPRRLVVANRTPGKAQQLVDSHAALARQCDVELQAATLEGCGTGFDLVLNATAASLHGGGVPVAGAVLARGALAYDMMYGPAAAGFLAWAREHGATGRDGLGMLVEQAAESFFVWRGVRPATAPVLAELRAQADAAGR
ncbi:shikimate dehydrogenase [Caldimonas thermodepolymerans]|uniref:Shikimate dehydrogenase (NADP(+)) n=1 Tax=Caldimonas thermodepolymerans TaxID=215580 RepID=A0AA46DGV4_9BURK|nr:shikimate dehydrogenase [Caldimonas thermodepolymerans]TCP09045.1 shikimate dehydrogenase [Caldimonas thermodepolymerans]UZG43678.1 shikimate dehydrogenase [Caldimonas thermodepolymerans]UZG47344.1 shikimate dehydrogenase [Caldimonas thermodepolymerans]